MKGKYSVRDCNYPWTWYLVGVEGDVRCCCFSSSPVGNVLAQGPEVIWNNLTMRSLRASLKAGVVHTVCRGAACKYVEGMKAAGKIGEEGEEKRDEESEPVQGLPAGFDEAWYVSSYYDVRAGIQNGRWKNGEEHFRRLGHRERRAISEADAKRLACTRLILPESQNEAKLYISRLDWSQSARAEGSGGAKILFGISVMNAGSATWSSDLIRPGARLYRNLSSVDKVAPIQEFRFEIDRGLAPGQSRELELAVPIDPFQPGRSFLVIDMVFEGRFWFSRFRTLPLVLGVEVGADGEIALATSRPREAPTLSTAGT